MMRLASLLFFAVGLLVGCGDKAVECTEALPCGFGEVCVEGVCSARSCATSSDCSMESYCNKGACTTGCGEDSDCYPGDACDSATQTCVSAGCRSSTLDCDFGQFCNTVTGECYDASGYYCLECLEDDDCGGNGNLCLSLGGGQNFCGVTCDQESDCPAAYTCLEVSSGGGGFTKQCLTLCGLYITDDSRRSSTAPGSTQALRPHLAGSGGRLLTCE